MEKILRGRVSAKRFSSTLVMRQRPGIFLFWVTFFMMQLEIMRDACY